MAGNNHPVVKMNLDDLQESAHSEIPVSPAGLAIDANDKVWVHNNINHKLMCLDSMLACDKEYDAHNMEHYTGNSTVWTLDDQKQVIWYKGEHECLVLDGHDGSVKEDIDYLVDQYDVIHRITGLAGSKQLLVITTSRTREDSILHRLTNQSGTCKATKKVKYADATDGKRLLNNRQRQGTYVQSDPQSRR